MKLRVVRCPKDAHDLPWVKTGDCEHWARKCPRAKKAKKSDHKFKGPEPGYLVAVTGIPPDELDEQGNLVSGWPYDYDPPAYELEPSLKWYEGQWVRDRDDLLTDGAGQGGVWAPANRGRMITCAQCGLTGAS